MTRFYLIVAFAAASVTGFVLILYAILTGSRANCGSSFDSAEAAGVELGFSDPVSGSGPGLLDLDMGHEGLKHKEKEAFDPARHKPQPI
jgi:hypothetical protein